MILPAMRLRGVLNSVLRHPARYVVGLGFLSLVYWGIFAVTRRGVRFVDTYPALGTIADAALQRSLETLFLVLALGVAFSVLTTAITTLYTSDDLPFLLSLPVAPRKIFSLKVAETYLNAALLPTLFTLPVLVALGLERTAPPGYYPLALAALLALYAIPVALGSLLALVLVRLSPAGRVKETATALSVVFAAGLVLGLRALRPERLAEMTPEEVERAILRFADLEVGWLPSSWAAQAVWSALRGEVALAIYGLALLSLGLLWLTARSAALAYQEGWLRSLESGPRRRDPTPRPPAPWERLLYRLGRSGSILVKDYRLLLRDPTQWSQLLVLLALAGVYLMSVGSTQVELQRFRDALGTMNVMFMGFLLAGVGIRTAYPLVSLEGEGFWLLRTGPIKSSQIVLAKFLNALPPMLLLGGGLGWAAAALLNVSPTLAFVSPIAGLSAALVTTGLGVGLGAAFPRFDATNPAEVPLSPGGLLYMTLSLGYAALLTLILAWPAWQTLRPHGGGFYWALPEGRWLLGGLAALTLLVTALTLLFGSRRLARYEPGG